MGVFKETADLLGLAFLFDFIKDTIERIKKFFIPPKAFSWQTLIYLSVFSWLMSSFAIGGIQDIIAFFGWVFLIAGTSWYTTDKPLYIPGTIMPVGAVITGGIISIFAFQQDEQVVARTIIFWPTISALITAVPEFFEGSGTDVKTQLPKLEDRESVITLIGCCMLLSCWLNLYGVTDTWLNEYPSAKYPVYRNEDYRRNDLLTILEPDNKTPKNGILILNKLQPAVETALNGKSWSNVELWLKNVNTNVNDIGNKVIEINLMQYDEKKFWKVAANVENIDPKDYNSGYRLDLLSVWNGPSATQNGYYLKRSCQIEPIAERDESIGSRGEKITVAEFECLPKISYIAGQPPQK
ncbi:MAG: septal junction protein FraD [Rivularia sp. ALOHA_DT_140]|nr:septal junction protein FraD [Rivularia sp. ALOHA_DT_140]